MADQAVSLCESFVVERQIKHRAWKVGAERAADLHRAHRTAGRRAAANPLDKFAERYAERCLVEAGIFDVARKLDRHGAARPTHAEVAIERAALLQNDRDRSERQYVVDDGRLAEQALVRRQRGLGTHNSAFDFETVEQRGFLAAHISASADPHFKVERQRRSGDATAEQTTAPRRSDRLV